MLACAARQLPDATDGVEDAEVHEALQPLLMAPEVPLAGLEALVCTPTDCWVWSSAGIQSLAPSGELGPAVAVDLDPAEAAVVIEGSGLAALVPCPEAERCQRSLDPATGSLGEAEPLKLVAPSDGRDPVRIREGWNQMRAEGWRVPFVSRVPTRDGGTLAYLRGAGGSSAQLARTGRDPQLLAWPAARGAVGNPRWLGMHPTGREAFLLIWPEPKLVSVDPDTLSKRWELAMRGPAHGLFIDASGRYLVVAEAGEIDPDRLLEYDPAGAPWPEGRDPAEDAAIRGWDRPSANSTVVIDLSGPAIAKRIAGAYRGFAVAPDGTVWLASDGGITRVARIGAEG